MKLLVTIALAASLTIPAVALQDKAAAEPMSSTTFSGMKLRNIGPAYMSGRISDIDVDEKDPATWYVAVASGGVWKTENAGTSWTPIFDKQAVYSTGDVTIDPSNSNIVWVGTGENNGGRHISFGDGVYRSDNGGQTWKNMGLKKTEHISDIVIHPSDSNTVWVSSQGPLWTKGGERGLFKTTDGGKTWRNVLEIDEWTGVTSLVIDPRNPDKLYAASWSRQRTLPNYVGTGPGTAIYTSDDGGETWSKLSKGLPKGNMGKIGMTISPQNPDVVYAIIEIDQRKGGFYRSSDRGASWVKMSDEISGGTGPHYYQEIFADPHKFDRVIMANNTTRITEDGGKTFKSINNKNKHVDDHAVAFHPTNPDFMLVGSDGGIYETLDSTKHWRFIGNLPLTQFYKVAMDDAKPFYFVYGGTQDNSTQGGPSRTDRDGIRNSDWFLTLGGDGHQPATEPGSATIVYSQSQQGNLARHDRTTGESMMIQPQAKPGEPAERYNWDAPINVSKHDSARIYHASQRVWRSDDRGDSWTAISGDLTRNENRMQMPVMGRTWSVEAGWDLYAMSNFNTIANFSESGVDENILYAGTDDGLIQVTSDGGKNWTRYEIGKIKGIPATAYVNDIRADLFDKDTVYAAFDNHKEGDYKPYLIKSTNRGKSWKSITKGLPEKTLVWRIVQDHVNKDLMFLGTEFGLYFTVNGGSKWIELTGDMPTISIRDVRIQRRENDLVAGSFGRGIYILDDYTPLRSLTADALEKDALLFSARTTPWYIPNRNHSRTQGDDQFVAKNPDFGATLTYYLKESLMTAKEKRQKADKALVKAGKAPLYPDWETVEAQNREEKPTVYLSIKDSDGNMVRRVDASAKKGIHRITWDLRYPSQSAITSGSEQNFRRGGGRGVLAAPGNYTATLNSRVSGVTTELAGPVTFDVELMRTGVLKGSARDEATAFARKTSNAMRAVSAASAVLKEMKAKVGSFRKALDRSLVIGGALDLELHALRAKILELEEALTGLKARERKGSTPATIQSRISLAMWGSSSTYGPTKTHREQFGYAMEAFGSVKDALNELTTVKMPNFQKALEAAGAPWTPGAVIPPAE